MSVAAVNVLEAQSICLTYPQPGGKQAEPVLEDFSLRLKAGEVLAVLGFSGAGKSTLLRVLAGLQPPTAGRVYVDGELMTAPHPRVGAVFQDPCLLPWRTLEANVAFGLNFKRQPKLTKQVRQERVREALAEVGLEYAAKAYPAALSGGMAQRGALARCLARQPNILMLDEPFSGLDEVTRGEMQQLLLRVVEHYKSAAILVTHDIDEALRVADRVILLGGRPAGVVGTWNLSAHDSEGYDDPRLTRIRSEIMDAFRDVGERPADKQRAAA